MNGVLINKLNNTNSNSYSYVYLLYWFLNILAFNYLISFTRIYFCEF